MNERRQFFFWIFTISVLIVLIVPTLVQDGMFMDGMLYASVSKNLSHGIGSFWFPHYSSTLYPFFDQQPPLGFGIQSLFFRVFGDSIYVERFYSFLCAIITAYLITRLWRLIFKAENEIRKVAWLPVLFWITIPVCFWAYSNNVLENTMAIFDLAAIIFILKYILQQQKLVFLLLAGIFIFLASFTKGIQGTFPVAALFFGWIVYRNFSFSKMVFTSLLLLLVPFSIYFLLLQDSNAFVSLNTYLNHRVLNSIQNVAEVQSRFYLVGRLILELTPAIVLTILILFISRNKMKQEALLLKIRYKSHILFLVLVGISASFPLMITLEQRGFYLVTSLPYFAIAISIVSAAGVSYLIGKINYDSFTSKLLRIISVLLFIGVIVFSFTKIGKSSRDEVMLHDVYLIGKAIPGGTVLGSTKELWSDWALQEYLVRNFYICLDDTILPENKFILVNDSKVFSNTISAEKVGIGTVKYHLFRITER